ncbi:uncharacterized protein [Magallana gigas]|uniref:uncharacterized protein n=1 Tax=Magallana gigas TaxID=29159 RepID=UPI00333F6454
MRECSRKVLFVPVGENPTRLSKPLSQLTKKKGNDHEARDYESDNQEEEEDDIWMTNIVERYQLRPACDPFPNMCLATFCSEYRVLSKSQIPKTKKEGIYMLQNGKGFVKRRSKTDPAVIRYPRFNTEKDSEKHYQSLLQLYLPYRQMTHLKPPGFDLYRTFYETGYVSLEKSDKLESVKQIVDSNWAQFAISEQLLDEAQQIYETIGDVQDAWATLCPETEVERENCDIERRKLKNHADNQAEFVADLENCEGKCNIPYTVTVMNSVKEQMVPLLRSLNAKQKQIFYCLREWCLKKASGKKPNPFHLFVTGGAGTGKSHLIKTINYEASRILNKLSPGPEDTTVLLTAFTGTAAFNIGGCTLHHAFSLNKYMPIPYEPLKEQSLSQIRAKLENLQILVIDEVSMVYKKLLYYIHERLVQIKKNKDPFGGVSILAVGDFFQLPPVKQSRAEWLFKENPCYPCDFWNEYFQLVELDEIMRQRKDLEFAENLNRLRTRTSNEELGEHVLQMLKRCVRGGNENSLHVFATNVEVNEHNLKMINSTCTDLREIVAKDFERDKTSGKMTLREKPFVRHKTDGMSSVLVLSVNARVMLIRNIDVSDGLVNGVIGTVLEISEESNGDIKSITVSFDNKKVGEKTGFKRGSYFAVQIHRYLKTQM